MRRMTITCAILVGACAQQPRPRDTRAPSPPVVLPASLSSERAALEEDVRAGHERLRAFAHRFRWDGYAREPFASRVEIFDDKARFDERLRSLSGAPADTKFPSTFTAALEQGVLVVCSPEIYARSYADGVEPHSYEKLVAHELAHRLQLRLLGGKDDEMGPVWFYEGFAVYAADQFAADGAEPTPDELWAVIENPKRGSYRVYGRLMRHLLKRIPLPELVEQARRPDFVAWLRRRLATP